MTFYSKNSEKKRILNEIRRRDEVVNSLCRYEMETIFLFMCIVTVAGILQQLMRRILIFPAIFTFTMSILNKLKIEITNLSFNYF